MPTLLRLLAALAAVLVAARFFQSFPREAAGPDSSWNWANNVAAARGMAFGRDIIFNFGPYSALATGLYDPALRGMILVGSAVLAVAFTSGLLALESATALLCIVVVLPAVTVMGALSFTLPLPAMLAAAGRGDGARLAGLRRFAVLAAAPAMGLLPLIKGSFLGIALIGLGTMCGLLWLRGERRLAAGLPLLAGLSLIVAWRAAGQHIAGLPAYVSATFAAIHAHNAGMAVAGPLADMAPALLACAGIMALLAYGAFRLQPKAAWLLAFGVAGLLFVIFKAGYVRQDGGHEIDSLAALGLMLVLLAGGLPRGAAQAAGVAGLVLLLAPLSPDPPFGPPALLVLGGPLPTLRAAARVIGDPGGLANGYRNAVARVPVLPWRPAGTADLYSFNQALLFASGLTWAPRPVFQSYAATTPQFAALNAAHLTGAAAPDNVFFRIEAIDGRFPAQEDGASWPALLSLYDPAGFDGAHDMAWLRRTGGAAPPVAPGAAIFTARPAMGERITLPPADTPLWASIDVRPSWAGRLVALLFRQPALRIRLSFAGGPDKSFALIPGMVRQGVLLSPLVTTTLDFLRLRQPDGVHTVALPRPTSIVIEPGSGPGPDQAWAWDTRYTLDIAKLALPALRTAPQITGVARPAPMQLPATPGGACMMDQVDGAALQARQLDATWPMTLAGWSLFDAPAGIEPEQTTIGLRSASGALFGVRVLQLPRNDVGASYHMAHADRAGFVAMFDASTLPAGDYDVLALPEHDGVRRWCRTALTITVK